jgi:hypothetical protein
VNGHPLRSAFVTSFLDSLPEIGGKRPTCSADVGYRADLVAKVENRTTLEISRKLIFGLLRRYVAFQRYY